MKKRAAPPAPPAGRITTTPGKRPYVRKGAADQMRAEFGVKPRGKC